MLTSGTRTLDVESRLVLAADADPGPGRRPCPSVSASSWSCWPAGRGRVFSRSELLERVFTDAESEAVIDTYVHYLRRKLGRDVIRTVRGLGYQLGSA